MCVALCVCARLRVFSSGHFDTGAERRRVAPVAERTGTCACVVRAESGKMLRTLVSEVTNNLYFKDLKLSCTQLNFPCSLAQS